MPLAKANFKQGKPPKRQYIEQAQLPSIQTWVAT
jgi:hypothetical protein